jgi:hypothetical protein
MSLLASVGLLMLHVATCNAELSAGSSEPRKLQAALAFRAVAVEATALIEPVIRQAHDQLAETQAPWGAADQLAWKLFFRSTHMHIGGVATADPLFAYYNPFSDVIFLGVWKFEDATKSPVVTTACLIPAETVLEASANFSSQPTWRTAKDPTSAIRKSAAAVTAALRSAFPQAKPADLARLQAFCGEKAVRISSARVYLMAASLGSMAQLGALTPVERLVTRTQVPSAQRLSAGLDLPAADADVLDALGAGFSKLAPAAVVIHIDEQQVLYVLVTSGSPRKFYSMLLSREASKWGLRRFTSWQL